MGIEKAEAKKIIGDSHQEESGFVPNITCGEIASPLEIIERWKDKGLFLGRIFIKDYRRIMLWGKDSEIEKLGVFARPGVYAKIHGDYLNIGGYEFKGIASIEEEEEIVKIPRSINL